MFQFINLAIIVGSEIENVGKICAAPPVNALVLVSYDEYVAVFRAQDFNQIVLYRVGVLKLVHVYVTELFLEIIPRFIVMLKQI